MKQLHNMPGPADGRFVRVGDAAMYRISNFDTMPLFLMSIVSDSDHWMYVATGGGLAAGRVEPERSLFPYETDDRLYRTGGVTGPFTLLRVARDGADPVLWEPLTGKSDARHRRRNLYKSQIGDTVVFEETRTDLGLTFRYRWSTSAEFGFIRTAKLSNDRPASTTTVEILDGLLNIMPANVPLKLLQTSSTLAEAYRRNEVDTATGMAIYSLESRITDGAEPAESLRANVAWRTGLATAEVVLSDDQVESFRQGNPIRTDRLTKGSRGHYLLNATIELDGAAAESWSIVADVYQSQLDVQRRRSQILESDGLADVVAADVRRGSDRLRSLVAMADGEQCTADPMATTHHFANTLFNTMRGGVIVDNGEIPVDDLVQFLEQRNRTTYRIHAAWLATLGERVSRRELVTQVTSQNDPDLERLCHEYLPLTFSRRHGDPSRPWNTFAINTRGEDGTRLLDYQGNWRDIFQNWEALCFSFPEYFESVVAKFVNASTVDGFNPYRVTRNGIEWEIPDPDDPWGDNIGYWGDHQIVYLLRLLEGLNSFNPNSLPAMLDREVFSYADVPYRIRPYDAILRDSKNTIEFDSAHAAEIADRAAIVGSDGKLLTSREGNVLHVTLAEKLLVPALAKLGNLVVDGGIWMNTQRPEWNDANNALVGNGASVVTLAYLRRFFEFCARLFANGDDDEYLVSAEVATWMEQTLSVLRTHRIHLESEKLSDRHRKQLLDRLGAAFSDYRATVYEHGFSGKAPISGAELAELCRLGLEYTDHSLRANRRPSGLYHSYNLIGLDSDASELAVDHLPEMLEGQVAALSAGMLEPQEVAAIVDTLYRSPLYRPDQNSFMLYPNRDLPSFLDRNTISHAAIDENPLLLALLNADDPTVVAKDAFGVCRFAATVTSSDRLSEALDQLSSTPQWVELVAANRASVADLFEDVFHHKQFTGRSGSMYKYEGLGSIYWHMVSKLLLAVQEAFWETRDTQASAAVTDSLARAYYRIRSGLSSDKTPMEYGAFPMDPYSHTPGHMGAQQPGMTGQVKEEILTRWGELGLRVHDGRLSFDPILLRRREFLQEQQDWSFDDVAGNRQTIQLDADSLGFTYCQVPIVYTLGEAAAGATVIGLDGVTTRFAGTALDRETSAAVFRRLGKVARIEVTVDQSSLAGDGCVVNGQDAP